MKIQAMVRGWLPLFFVVLVNAAWGADSFPPAENFFQNPDKSLAVISPKGNYVAYVTPTKDGAQSIEVRETAELNRGSVVVNTDAGGRIHRLRWVNENRLVFVLTQVKSEFYAWNDTFVINRDGSDLSLLISGLRATQSVTGSHVKSKQLSADYRLFATPHDGSDDILVLRTNRADTVGQFTGTHLFRLNTKTQLLSELLDSTQPGYVSGWTVDQSDFPRIAYSRKDGICKTSYLAPETTSWSELSSGDCLQHDGIAPLFFESPTSLLVAKTYDGVRSVYRYDLVKRELASKPLLTLSGMDFIGSIESDTATKTALGIHYDGDAHGTLWLNPKFKDIQQKVDQVLKATTNRISCGSDCLNAPAVLVESSSDRQPTKYYVYNIAQDRLVGFGGEFPKIDPAQMGTRNFAYFTARDGMKIPVYYTLPPGKTTTAMPTVVLVHGGPWFRGSSWEWEADAQFLASRGYVVIQPEYRGSFGFGFDHFKAGWKQWGLAMQDDLADAALWAVGKGWADPNRIGIMGGYHNGYGGYATLMGLIKNPELFRCGVDWAGLTDLSLRFDTPYDDLSQEVLNYDLKTMIGDPVADAAMFKKNSPLQNADKLTQPLLIAHGRFDNRVPILHSSKLYSAVKGHNNNVELLVYEDEYHGWYHPENRIDFWKHVDTFLDKNLKNINN